MRKIYCDLCGREVDSYHGPTPYTTSWGAEREICNSCACDIKALKSAFEKWKKQESTNRPEDFVSEKVIGQIIVGDFDYNGVQLLVSEEKE